MAKHGARCVCTLPTRNPFCVDNMPKYQRFVYMGDNSRFSIHLRINGSILQENENGTSYYVALNCYPLFISVAREETLTASSNHSFKAQSVVIISAIQQPRWSAIFTVGGLFCEKIHCCK